MIILKLCAIFLLVHSASCFLKNETRSVVVPNVGTIKGLKASDGDYYMFMGIPYAQVDTENPFGLSTSQPRFTETFEAFDEISICPQEYQGTLMGAIDCLKLNIYVPTSVYRQKNLQSKIPVMVYLYGGGFQHGHAGKDVSGPNYLVRHDVILVVINYRVGPYGFMCLDIPEVAGNQGLKDQYIALKWIKDNIAAFGGNPNKITVFGHSAGGHSIDLHLMSNKNVLFNKILLQTGSAEALTVLFEPDKQAPIKMANHLGFKTNDTEEALSFLTKSDRLLVVSAGKSLNIQFKPCVEQIFDNDTDTFISKSWINLEVPKVKDIPVLMGFNNLEMAYLLYPQENSYFDNLTLVYDNLNRLFQFPNKKLNDMTDMVSDFYFGDEDVNAKLKWDVTRYSSDITYIHPVHRTLKKYLEYEAGPIYFYMFSYVGGRSAVVTNTYDGNSANGHLCCASHGDEVFYIFTLVNKPRPTKSDQLLIDRITTMWTNFAKYSDPTPDLTNLLPVKWQPVTPDTYYYLNIDKKLSLGRKPLRERMAYWDLFFKFNKKYQNKFD